MLAKDLISEYIIPLKLSDTDLHALHLMDIFRLGHLPVVNEKELIGLISENDIIDFNDPDEEIEKHKERLVNISINNNQHLYEVIDLVSQHKISVIPVLDENKHYLGVITITDLMQHLANLFSLKQPGSIISLSMQVKDYTLSEIANIVEGNDAKILSLYITSQANGKIEITLRINKEDISSVVKTFERYNYSINTYFTANTEVEDFYKERYDAFIRYMNI